MRQLNLFAEETARDIKKEEESYKAKSYTGLYGLHKYWGKKPYNIMADFIKKYTTQNEIVLDPFLGSGVSVTEAVFNKRKGIGVDINPSAVFITSQILVNIDIRELLAEYKLLENDVKEKINSFYLVKRNGKTYLGQNFLWENETLTEVRFTNGTRSRHNDLPSKEDIDLAKSFKTEMIESFYPDSVFFHNSRINTKSTEDVSKLFTERNLYALSILFERIEQIQNSSIQDILKFCFTSAIGQTSKMVFVIKRRNKTKTGENLKVSEKKEVGSWVIGYWKPADFFENNVWTCFETRFKKILKAKKEQLDNSEDYKIADSFDLLKQSADYLLVNQPSQHYLKSLEANSIDYILSDPPHGNRIPYLELSMLWNSWLKKTVNYEDEIIISEAKERQKDSANYNQLMNIVIKECFRVLKPDRHFSFMFNSLDDNSWLNVIKTFHEVGFELESVETLGYSANSVVQDNRKNGLQTDFIITYRKPSHTSGDKELDIINLTDYPRLMSQIDELKAKGYKSYQIMNSIFCETLKNNQFFHLSQLLKAI